MAEREGDMGMYTRKKTKIERDWQLKGTKRETQRTSGGERERNRDKERDSKDMERETD